MRGCLIALTILSASPAFAQGIVIDGDTITFPDGSTQSAAPEGLFSDRTVVVSPEIDMPAASGQSLLDAVDAIATAGDATANFPYFIFIEPGNYSLVDASLTLPAFVHLRGAGMDATFITSRPGGTDAVVETTQQSTIQDLTIRHVGTGSETDGRALTASGDVVRLEDVRLLVRGDYAAGATLTAVSTANGCHLELIDCVVDIEAGGSLGTVTGVVISASPSSLFSTGTQVTVNPVNEPAEAFGIVVLGSDAVNLSDMRIFARSASNFGAGIRAQNGGLVNVRSCRVVSNADFAIYGSTDNDATPVRLAASEIGGALQGDDFVARFIWDTNFAAIQF